MDHTTHLRVLAQSNCNTSGHFETVNDTKAHISSSQQKKNERAI